MRFLRIAPIALAALAACSSEVSTTQVETHTTTCLCNLTVSPAAATITIGDRIQLAASEGTKTPVVRWRSSNIAIATVDSVTGVTTAVSVGNVTIIAAEVRDPTLQGAAAITVGNPMPPPDVPAVSGVIQVATGLPANLGSLYGDVDVVVSTGGTVRLLSTASLVINNGVRDTTVSTQTLATGEAGFWRLRWATAARVNDAPVFPNGTYTFKVVFAGSSATVVSTRTSAVVVNP